MGNWNFGDTVGSSFTQGQEIGLKQKQMALEKIKMKWEQLKEQNSQSMKLLDDPHVPDAQKKDIWNGPVVKFNALLGITLPPMTEWNDALKKSIASQADASEQVAKGTMTVGEYKTRLAYNMATAAKDPAAAAAFKGYEALGKDLEGGPLETLHIGGKDVQVRRDINGQNQIQTAGGEAATSPSALSVTQEDNRQKNAAEAVKSFLAAANTIDHTKDSGILESLAHLIPNFKELSPEDQAKRTEEVLHVAHGPMYFAGGQLGISTEDVTNIILGKKSAADVMNRAGKNFKIDGAKNPAPPTNLPGLTIQPKPPTISEAPTGATPDATMAAAPTPAPDAGAAPAPQLADNASNPTDQEEANV